MAQRFRKSLSVFSASTRRTAKLKNFKTRSVGCSFRLHNQLFSFRTFLSISNNPKSFSFGNKIKRSSAILVRNELAGGKEFNTSKRFFSGPRDIDLIKLIRDVTGCPLKECKEAFMFANDKTSDEFDLNIAVEYLRKKGVYGNSKAKSQRDASDGLVGVCVNSDNSSAALVEFSCETDFVAKNLMFQSLVETTLMAVLDTKELGSGSIDKDTIPTLTFESPSGPATIQQCLSQVVDAMRENICFKRGIRLDVDTNQSIISPYIHNSLHPVYKGRQWGKIGAIVTLPVQHETMKREDVLNVGKKVAMHIVAAKPTYFNRTSVPKEVLEKEREILREQALGEGKPENIVEKMIEGRLNKFYQENVLMDQQFLVQSDPTAKPLTVTKFLKDQNLEILGYDIFRVGES